MDVCIRTELQGQHNINLHPFTQQQGQAFWHTIKPDIRVL